MKRDPLQFEAWRKDACQIAVELGLSVKITDEHWDWFRDRYDEGHTPAEVAHLALSAGLT